MPLCVEGACLDAQVRCIAGGPTPDDTCTASDCPSDNPGCFVVASQPPSAAQCQLGESRCGSDGHSILSCIDGTFQRDDDCVRYYKLKCEQHGSMAGCI